MKSALIAALVILFTFSIAQVSAYDLEKITGCLTKNKIISEFIDTTNSTGIPCGQSINFPITGSGSASRIVLPAVDPGINNCQGVAGPNMVALVEAEAMNRAMNRCLAQASRIVFSCDVRQCNGQTIQCLKQMSKPTCSPGISESHMEQTASGQCVIVSAAIAHGSVTLSCVDPC